MVAGTRKGGETLDRPLRRRRVAGWAAPHTLSLASLLLIPACERRDSDGPKGAGIRAASPVQDWIARAKTAPEGEDREAIASALAGYIADADGRLLVEIADALGALGPDARAAAPALTGLLSHEDPWVRVAAMETLGGIGAAAVPSLVDAFEKGSASVRVRAGIVLGEMGEKARSAIPAIERALQDPSPDMRARATAILAQISPASAESASDRGAPSVALPAAAPAAPAAPAAGAAKEWPQFRGPGRDGVSPDTGLLDEWPEGGPPLLWEREGLGRGYSSVSIAAGRLITMGDRAEGGGAESQLLIAIDLATRKDLFTLRIGPPHEEGGPRSTPAIDGDRVYAIGTEGDLVCVRIETGDPVWRKSFASDFGGAMMSGWKYSESPLIDGDRLICTPGGKDAMIVALDKRTGATIWTCAVPPLGEKGKDGAGYSSIVAAEIRGVRQYVQIIGRGAVGIEAATGRFLWGYNRIATEVANIPSAIVTGDYVFVTASYGTGSALLEIRREGDAFRAEEARFFGASAFQNHHGGVVLVANHIYGGHGQNAGAPTCLDLATGEVAWKAKAPARGSASTAYADGHVIFRYDRGLVVLAGADPKSFRVKGRFTPPSLGEGPAWSHPVVCDGRLYLRHGDRLACYDLRDKE